MIREVCLMAIPNIPLIKEGDNLGNIIVQCCRDSGLKIVDHDVLVIAQKVVSKAEGALVRLSTVKPTPEAQKLAEQTGRDSRLCQVYIDEATEIIEVKGRMVITRHRLGFKGSGSFVDSSNVATKQEGVVVLLPQDPDRSVRQIRETIKTITGHTVAVIMNDSLGCDDRDGSMGMAIGIAGISHLEFRQQRDLYDNESRSRIDLVDELAAAASMLMGQADESTPAVLIRGVPYTIDENASISKMLNT